MDRAIDPDPASGTAGFTLVELLVAVAVLAVLAVGASLAATRGAPGATDAARFADSHDRVRALAVRGRARGGLYVTAQGWQLARATARGWVPVGRPVRWRGRVAFAPRGAAPPPPAPQIVFLPDGRASAFSIRFGGTGGTTCDSDGWTGLRCGG